MRKALKWAGVLLTSAALISGCGLVKQDKGVLKVGVRDDIMGLGYLNPVTNEYYGLEIDLAKEMAGRMGYSGVEFTTVNPENRKETLLEGKVDCLIACYSIEETRLENFDFSPAYFTDYTSIMVEKSTLMTGIEDLVGKRTGVLKGANTAPKISDKLMELGLITETDLKGSSLEYRDTYEELSIALEEGAVDAVCMDGGIARAYMEEDRLIMDDVVGSEQYGVATKKDSPLSQPVAETIQEMLDDGTIAGMTDKWY